MSSVKKELVSSVGSVSVGVTVDESQKAYEAWAADYDSVSRSNI